MQYFLNHSWTPLDMYNPKVIVSNKKEESISIQRVKYLNFTLKIRGTTHLFVYGSP